MALCDCTKAHQFAYSYWSLCVVALVPMVMNAPLNLVLMTIVDVNERVDEWLRATANFCSSLLTGLKEPRRASLKAEGVLFVNN